MTAFDSSSMSRKCSFVLLLLLAPVASVWAQDAAPGYVSLRIQTVQPGQIGRWESLRKEFTEASREAGVPFYHVYQRQLGDVSTYLMIAPANSIGQPGMAINEPPEVALPDSWFDAIQSTLHSHQLIMAQNYPNLATLEGQGPHPAANYMHVRIRTPVAGRGTEFEEWLEDDLVPALREAEAGDVRNLRVVLGASPRTWLTYSFVDGFPEAPVEIDPRILQRGEPLIASQTDYFYRFRDDLSFTQ
jgi:hypothetical protein